MNNPLELVNKVGDTATGVVSGIGNGIVGMASKLNADITRMLNQTPILGQYGPHKAVDKLVAGSLASVNGVGNCFIGGIQKEGHTIVSTAETPFDQVTGMVKR